MTPKEKAAYQKKYRDDNAERLRAYRVANKERIAARNKAWAAKNRAIIAEKRAKYLARNKARTAARYAAWYQEHRDATDAQKAAYRALNVERARKRCSEYHKNNPDVRRRLAAKRRARLLQATPAWFDEFDAFVMAEAYRLAVLRAKTLGFAWHVDHVLPLKGKKVCGLHVGLNVQVIPAAVNLKKKNAYTP